MKAQRWCALLALAAACPLQGQETTTETDYQRAVEARQRGNAAEAVRLLQPIVAADPANSDAQVQLGFSLLAVGSVDAAEEAFRAALATAPEYDDARLGLAQIALRRGQRDLALREISQLDSSDPEVRRVRELIEREAQLHAWSVDLDSSTTAVGSGRSDWYEGTVQVRRHLGMGTTVGARLEVLRRFGKTDTFGEILVDRRVSDRGRLYLAVGGTPDADFRPRWQIGGGGSWRLTDGGNASVVTLDVRHAEYSSGDIQTIAPGIEQYVAGGRAWITGRAINVIDDGDYQIGFLVRSDALVRDDLRIYAGYSDAPDTSEGFVIDTQSWFGGASYDLTSETTLRASVSFDDPDIGPHRMQFGLGLGLKF